MREFFFEPIQQYLILNHLIASGTRRVAHVMTARKSQKTAVASVKQQMMNTSPAINVEKTAVPPLQQTSPFLAPSVLAIKMHTKTQYSTLMAASSLMYKNMQVRSNPALVRTFASTTGPLDFNGQNEAVA